MVGGEDGRMRGGGVGRVKEEVGWWGGGGGRGGGGGEREGGTECSMGEREREGESVVNRIY